MTALLSATVRLTFEEVDRILSEATARGAHSVLVTVGDHCIVSYLDGDDNRMATFAIWPDGTIAATVPV